VTARHLFPTGTPEMAIQAPVSRSSGNASSTSTCGFNAGPGFSSSNSAYMQRSAHWFLFCPEAFGVVEFCGDSAPASGDCGFCFRFAFLFFLPRVAGVSCEACWTSFVSRSGCRCAPAIAPGTSSACEPYGCCCSGVLEGDFCVERSEANWDIPSRMICGGSWLSSSSSSEWPRLRSDKMSSCRAESYRCSLRYCKRG